MNTSRYLVSSILSIAKEIIAIERVVAETRFSYTNSGLDMGQYEESRWITITLKLDEKTNNFVMYADFEKAGISPYNPGKKWTYYRYVGNISDPSGVYLSSVKFVKQMADEANLSREYKDRWSTGVGGGIGSYKLKDIIKKVCSGTEDTEESLIEDLSTLDLAVLLATRRYKPSYARIKDLRKHYVLQTMHNVAPADVDNSRLKLIQLGFLLRNKALSPKGNEAVAVIRKNSSVFSELRMLM